MKKNKLRRLLQIAGIFSILLLLLSCENIVDQKTSQEQPDSTPTALEGKTYLTIRAKTGNPGRTVLPSLYVNVNNLKNFVLTGTPEDEGADPINIEKENLTALQAAPIEVTAGKWKFTLTAKYTPDPAVPETFYMYSDTINSTINRGTGNSVNFTLRPQQNEVGFKIHMDLSAQPYITKVEKVLTTLSGDIIINQTQAPMGDSLGSITFEKVDDLEYDPDTDPLEEKPLEPGTYHAIISFYAGDDPTIVNQWESYIRIAPCFVTEASVTMDFNTVYTITYDLDGGTEKSGMKITRYSARSNFNLPILTKENQVFLGWIKTGTDTVITKITSGMSGDLSLVAKFVDPVLYVSSSSGNDETNTGFSSSSPLKTMDKEGGALDKILEYGKSDLAWTINIDGETSGKPRGYSGTNQNYGQIELPSEITSEVAKSILITGATEHSNWLNETTIPDDLDTINRGGNGSANTLSSGDSNGAALVVSTAVPVTITNLKITGGSGYNGGGILINEGATVSIGDGVLITKNRASNKGGAICNLGTLFIYGSAVIGDKDATGYPTISSTQDISSTATANYSSIGGGIYNGDPSASTVAKTTLIANLYLGYKPSETDLSPVEEEFTGGIYCNGGGSKGGGIYNAINSKVYMKSGTLSRNGVDQGGGGIYNDDGSILNISGGNIHTNRVHQNGSIVKGGGVENYGRQSKFVMSGGSIYNNEAWADSGTDGQGGGVFNGGYMFMYGTATIGKVPSELSTPIPATSSSCSNKANMGGGIYNAGDSGDIYGRLYIGYKPDDTYTIPEATQFTGGIYYNYSEIVKNKTGTSGGGGICSSANNAYGEFKMSSGTIAYNATNDYGGGICGKIVTLNGENNGINIYDNTAEIAGNAIYIEASNRYYLDLSGSIDIPKGQDNSHDIFIGGTGASFYSHIQISNNLEGNLEAIITPETYIANIPLVSLATGSTANLEAECKCFGITPPTKEITNDGSETEETMAFWLINGGGKLCKAFDMKVTITSEKATFLPLAPESPAVIFTEIAWYVDDAELDTIMFPGSKDLLNDDITSGTHVIKLEAKTEDDDTYEFLFNYNL